MNLLLIRFLPVFLSCVASKKNSYVLKLANTILLFFLFAYQGNAQTNFDKEQSAANPVRETDVISIKEKLVVHLAYLEKAIKTNNNNFMVICTYGRTI